MCLNYCAETVVKRHVVILSLYYTCNASREQFPGSEDRDHGQLTEALSPEGVAAIRMRLLKS